MTTVWEYYYYSWGSLWVKFLDSLLFVFLIGMGHGSKETYKGLGNQKDIGIKAKRNNKRIKEIKGSTKIKKWLPERLIHLYYVQWYQGITATT